MTRLVRLSEYRRKAAALHFNRTELNQLLGLYTSRVIKGEWRDYSIDTTVGYARFCIHRSSQEEPLFSITKLATKGKAKSAQARRGRYVVSNRHRKVSQSDSLTEALKVFEKPLKLVSR